MRARPDEVYASRRAPAMRAENFQFSGEGNIRMKLPETTDTIAAQATPPGAGALAVLRLSGPKAFAIASEDGEIVNSAGDGVGPGIDQRDRWIARQLLPRLGQDVRRWLVIVAQEAVRVAGEAIARQAGIQNSDLAAGTAKLQGRGETGKAAADDDDVIHGDGLRVTDGRGRGLAQGPAGS